MLQRLRAFFGEVDPVRRSKMRSGNNESRFHVSGIGSRTPLRLFSLTILSALLVLATAAPSLAQDGSAKQFLQEIYKHYVGADAPGVMISTPDAADRYFEASIVKQLMKPDPEYDTDEGGLSFDPFANGQEIEIKSVDITVVSETAERAKATASFRNAGRKQTVTFDLVKTAKGWRIADMSWSGTQDTLRSILAERS